MAGNNPTGRNGDRGRPTWTDADSARLTELHAEGVSLNRCATEMGWSTGSIQKYAKSLGLQWDRSKVAAANEARKQDCADLRGQLELDYLLDAQRFRGKNLGPYRYQFQSGVVDADQPFPSDQLKFQQASIASSDSSRRISQHAAGSGIEDTKSMLARMGAALGVETYVPTDDGDDDGEADDDGPAAD